MSDAKTKPRIPKTKLSAVSGWNGYPTLAEAIATLRRAADPSRATLAEIKAFFIVAVALEDGTAQAEAVAAAVSTEREACAALAMVEADKAGVSFTASASGRAKRIAQAIRARGKP